MTSKEGCINGAMYDSEEETIDHTRRCSYLGIRCY